MRNHRKWIAAVLASVLAGCANDGTSSKPETWFVVLLVVVFAVGLTLVSVWTYQGFMGLYGGE